MIRSTFHHFRKILNAGKISALDNFIQEYREAVNLCVSYIWNLKIEWAPNKIWNREKDYLNCPTMISTVPLNYKGKLSGRALKCAATQACGIVAAVAEKRQKDLNKKKWLCSTNKSVSKGLQNRLDKSLIKPECNFINCELNSICMDIKWEDEKHFNGFLNLKSLWSKESEYKRGFNIKVPIKHYRRSIFWSKKGKLLNSILLNEKLVTLRWEINKPEKLKEGKTIAIDQGLTDILTSSDNQKSAVDKFGHTFISIIEKLARKRKNSKAFNKAVEHRKNYINFCVKSLNLMGVKEIKLEDIHNIFYGRNVNRKMKHWTNTLIRDSLKKLCEETGVLFTLVANEFNSQRCSKCGWTQKSNRKSKIFFCNQCGFEIDADLNASYNILIRDTLFKLPYDFRKHRLNLRGFFWNFSGLSDVFGQVLTVPVVSEK